MISRLKYPKEYNSAMYQEIDISKINYTFRHKPLLIGGNAMEYYELRKPGVDVDFVVANEDYEGLKETYSEPEYQEDIWGDLGVKIGELEFWKCICLFEYEFLAEKAIEKKHYKIISLEKLLFLKALAMNKKKYRKDLKLIVQKFLDDQYDDEEWKEKYLKK